MAAGPLKLDILLYPSNDFRADAELIRRAEHAGYDAAWIAEGGRNPFFALTIAAAQTSRIQLGAWSALAFPRSPMVTAQIVWDLARQSGGRFVLGLGNSLPSCKDEPGSEESLRQIGRLREYIESLRAIWNTFQTDARLRFRGEHYTFRLMAPFFNPGPIDAPHIPIFVSGIDSAHCQLAGEHCQGLLAPALMTPSFLKNELLPAVDSGLNSAARERAEMELATPVFVVTGKDKAEQLRAKQAAKRHIEYLARPPANHGSIPYLGWEKKRSDLNALAALNRPEQMSSAMTDETLEAAAIVAEPKAVRAQIEERCAGAVERACVYIAHENTELIEIIMKA